MLIAAPEEKDQLHSKDNTLKNIKQYHNVGIVRLLGIYEGDIERKFRIVSQFEIRLSFLR